MNKTLADKLLNLPKVPGVYFHKDKSGRVIYIGKAAILSNRVRQYFQKSRSRDPKTELLVSEIADIDWIEVETELDALFLEAELVRRYLPKYNILLRDDKSLVYIRITYNANHPTVSYSRRPIDDGAEYFGPYFGATALKRAMSYLRRAFPYSTHVGSIPKRVCLQYHLGLCPGLEEGKTSLKDYRANLRRLIKYLKGERVKLMNNIEKDMRREAKAQNYELAAKYRNQLKALRALSKRVIFSDKEVLDINKDQGLNGLANLLGMSTIPRKIEGYDISHMQGAHNTASLVVFINGLPDKASYRKFKLRVPGNNDFAHLEETITRRLSPSNQSKWPLPELFLIDGGKGQLSSAIKSRDGAGATTPMIGLAKREEEIVIDLAKSKVEVNRTFLKEADAITKESAGYLTVLLPKNSPVVQLLQRIRDESHRFAVSYHSTLKSKAQTASFIDEIPGIGPVTRRRLMKEFGSLSNLTLASQADIQKVVGASKAKMIEPYLNDSKAT